MHLSVNFPNNGFMRMSAIFKGFGRGVAMLEVAILLIPLVLLVAGLIDAGYGSYLGFRVGHA